MPHGGEKRRVVLRVLAVERRVAGQQPDFDSHSIWRDELNAKKRITTAELALLIMREIRKHPECAHVMSVGFTRPPQRASGDPNWAPSWSMDGPKYRPGITEQIGRDFQNRFDLV
jgi:hypothetical protein